MHNPTRWILMSVALAAGMSGVRDAHVLAAAQRQRPAEVTRRDADGSTPLHRAAERNDLAAVDALLDAGADPKAETRYHITPLYFAALNGNAAMIERLLDAGADANTVSHEGQPTLMTAALSGNPDAVRLLLVRGAKVDAIEPFKHQTALMWAAAEPQRTEI